MQADHQVLASVIQHLRFGVTSFTFGRRFRKAQETEADGIDAVIDVFAFASEGSEVQASQSASKHPKTLRGLTF